MLKDPAGGDEETTQDLGPNLTEAETLDIGYRPHPGGGPGSAYQKAGKGYNRQPGNRLQECGGSGAKQNQPVNPDNRQSLHRAAVRIGEKWAFLYLAELRFVDESELAACPLCGGVIVRDCPPPPDGLKAALRTDFQ